MATLVRDKSIRYVSLTRSIDTERHLGHLMTKAVAGEITSIVSILLRHGGELLSPNVQYFKKENVGIYNKIKAVIVFRIEDEMFEYLKEEKLMPLGLMEEYT